MSEEAPGAVATNAVVARRQALCGVAALGVLGATALSACSSEKEFGQPSGEQTTGEGSPPDTGSTGAGVAVATLADIPQGGGKVVGTPSGKPIVVVRAADGSVKAFSAVCTHQGVTVSDPQNGVMTCPKHNSKFNAADGSVAGAPATSPLAPVAVKVEGENIVLV